MNHVAEAVVCGWGRSGDGRHLEQASKWASGIYGSFQSASVGNCYFMKYLHKNFIIRSAE